MFQNLLTRFKPVGHPNDFMASIVVFLVALPLCMGIAIASGAPPAAGLVTGIVGGLLVGLLAGSPLQVSGPAAGLVVLVWDIVQTYGMEGLGLAVLIAGAVQVAAGAMGMGQWFRAVPPALIQGMLAGIGVLIFASQFFVMLDLAPQGAGIKNLIAIPGAVAGLFGDSSTAHAWAALTGVVTIVSIVLWNRFKPRALAALPGPLVGVLAGAVFAGLLALEIRFVDLPSNLLGALKEMSVESAIGAFSLPLLGAAISLAFVASAESLLCAAAVDQMHSGPRTQYNRELIAQGVGNVVCGALGGLPMTGVIVRSTANVQAGAKTRWSAVLHGAWILVFVVALPGVLKLIPTAALAGVLVFTGYKLVNVGMVKQLYQKGRAEVLIYATTLLTIVAVDLLTGVITGLVVSLMKVLYERTRLSIHVDEASPDGTVQIKLKGAATFVTLPHLASTLDRVPQGKAVKLCTDELEYLDHACQTLLQERKVDRESEPATNTA